MRKILIVILILYTYLSIGQIPLMVNNKPNKKIHFILDKKYNSYKDTCIAQVNKQKYRWKHDYNLKVNDFKIKVFSFIYLKNEDLKIDSTTNIMNEILIDTFYHPCFIQFYKDNILWGYFPFGRLGNIGIQIIDEVEPAGSLTRNFWNEIFSFGADNIFFIKGDEGIILQKDNSIYYYYTYKDYLPFNERIEPLSKYLMNKMSEKKLDNNESWIK